MVITGFDNDEKAYIMVRAINAHGKSRKRSAVKKRNHPDIAAYGPFSLFYGFCGMV